MANGTTLSSLTACVSEIDTFIYLRRLSFKRHLKGTESKVLDPRDASTGLAGAELLDPSLAKRGEQWWMYLAGQAHGHGPTEIYSASLPRKAALSATGWNLTRDAEGQLEPLAGRSFSGPWDGKGGRHCPSYVKGWDPHKRERVERIYYAGAAENLWGPYRIGFLQWDRETWMDQPEPAFSANEEWEHGSVYEANLVYHDGKWKMWYVAGSNHEDYLVHGYAERVKTVSPAGASMRCSRPPG